MTSIKVVFLAFVLILFFSSSYGNQINCTSPDYYYNESDRPFPFCFSDCECDGMRICNDSNQCQGIPRYNNTPDNNSSPDPNPEPEPIPNPNPLPNPVPTPNTTNNTNVTPEPSPNPPPKPNPPVPVGDGMLWVVGYYTYTWFYTSTQVEHQDMGIYLKFIDRLPNAKGGLVWSINPSKGVAFRNGTIGPWTSRPGIAAKYLRISPFDLRVWAIDANQYVYSISQTGIVWTKENSNIQVTVLDVSASDGSVYGVKADNTLWYTSGVNNGWNQIMGYSVKYIRVISNGNIFALTSNNGSVIFRANITDSWQVLSGQSSFTFIDVNNKGLILGIKSDNSVWRRDYIAGTWNPESTMKFSTLRVLDDNSIFAVGVKNYDGANGLLYYNNGSGYVEMKDWAFTLWGPTNCNVWF